MDGTSAVLEQFDVMGIWDVRANTAFKEVMTQHLVFDDGDASTNPGHGGVIAIRNSWANTYSFAGFDANIPLGWVKFADVCVGFVCPPIPH